MKPRYSGPKSRKFWNRINALDQPEAEVLYEMACVLQNLENAVLRQLANAESPSWAQDRRAEA